MAIAKNVKSSMIEISGGREEDSQVKDRRGKTKK